MAVSGWRLDREGGNNPQPPLTSKGYEPPKRLKASGVPLEDETKAQVAWRGTEPPRHRRDERPENEQALRGDGQLPRRAPEANRRYGYPTGRPPASPPPGCEAHTTSPSRCKGTSRHPDSFPGQRLRRCSMAQRSPPGAADRRARSHSGPPRHSRLDRLRPQGPWRPSTPKDHDN